MMRSVKWNKEQALTIAKKRLQTRKWWALTKSVLTLIERKDTGPANPLHALQNHIFVISIPPITYFNAGGAVGW